MRPICFKHALVQDAAYGMLLREPRRALHAQIAEKSADIAERQPELLARHCTAAGLIERGVSYWLPAARNAAARYANVEAIAHLRRGIDGVDRLDKPVARMGDALQRAEAVKDPHTQAYVCYYASVLYALRGEPNAAYQYAERCLTFSEEHGFRRWRGLSRAIHATCAADSILLARSIT
jgi:hypothetical protein